MYIVYCFKSTSQSNLTVERRLRNVKVTVILKWSTALLKYCILINSGDEVEKLVYPLSYTFLSVIVQ